MSVSNSTSPRGRSRLHHAGRRLQQSYRRQCARWPALPYLLVFFVAGLLAVYLHSTPTFADPDSFYHARISALIAERGVFTALPWLQFTVLRDSFADHQFLYHVALVPFVIVWPPLVGIKLATIVFFAAAVTACYALLRAWQVRQAWLPTALLLVSSPFIFRANLAKAQPLMFLALFAFLGSVTRRRRWAVAVISFLYVWLYGGWPLLLLVAALLTVAEFLTPSAPVSGRGWRGIGRRVSRAITQTAATWAAVAGGLAAGLVINPYFPHNLKFYWNQIVQIAVINYRDTIGVGAEWYAYAPLELLAASSLATFALVIGLTVYGLTVRRQPPRVTLLLLLTLLFYGLTWRSRRNVEYLIPFELLFTATAIHAGLAGLPFRQFGRELTQFFREQRLFVVAAVLPLLLTPYIVVRDVVSTRSAFAAGIPFTRYAGAMAWLSAHSPPNALVFHSDWDDFPVLFYHNPKNYYLVGLDPTFMYRYDQVRYWQWERVTTGRERRRLHEVVAQSFAADYVFVGSEQEAMGKLVANNPGFREAYHDQEARIFEVLAADN